MTIQVRHYKEEDLEIVINFLKDIFKKWSVGEVFVPARWEYIVYHPNTLSLKKAGGFDKCGLWEEDGKIVGFAHFESELGEVYLDLDPLYTFLYPEMIEYAENHLFEIKEDGRKCIEFHVPETNELLKSLLKDRGYSIDSSMYEVYSEYHIPDNLIFPQLPEGLTLRNIQKEVDDERRLRILWRGFNHTGEPNRNNLWESDYMQSAPGYEPSLNIVIENEEGHIVAYAGFWFDGLNSVAYIEPVCVDPDFRHRGLAAIALIEGIRRCKQRGAESVYVASNLSLYMSLGFSVSNTSYSWLKDL